MLYADTIKIISKDKYLIKTKSTFNKMFNPTNGIEKGIYYSSKNDSKIPFNIYVAIDSYGKLTMEFSSKILGKDYPKLISTETIRECLENMNTLNICQLDIEGILNDSIVSDISITKDFVFELTDEILTALNTNVNGYKRFKWKHYEGEGISFSSDIKGSRGKESIIFYNKSKEIIKWGNSKFLNSLGGYKDEIITYFTDKTRIEIILNTQDKIKSYLNIDNTKLMTVLRSDSNPILIQFDKIFDINKEVQTSVEFKPSEWEKLQVLTLYRYDIKMIEQELRRVYSDNGLYKVMKKYKNLILKVKGLENTNHIKEIRKLLE